MRGLRKIIIPDSVTSIENFAFEGCASLTSIKLPDSIKEIDYNVFYRTPSLKKIEGADDLEIVLYSDAFKNEKSVTTVNVPEIVTTMYSDSFKNYEKIVIGKNLKKIIAVEYDIDDVDFELKEIVIDEENPYLCYDNGTVYNKDKTKALYVIPRYAFEVEGTCGENLNWKVEDFKIQITGTGEMTNCNAGEYPWSNFLIVSVAFEGENIKIADNAFYDMKYLQSLDLSGVTEIGTTSFFFCKQLSSIINDESVEFVEPYAFTGTEWIGKNDMKVLGSVLIECDNISEEIVLPDNIKYVAHSAFSNSKVKTLYLPKSDVLYNGNAFINNNSIEHVKFIGSGEDICLDDIKEAAKLCKEVNLKDENGNTVSGLGYKSDNTIMCLADALRDTPFINNMVNDYCENVIQSCNCTSEMTDIQLITAIWDYFKSNVKYKFVYSEDLYGTLYDENDVKWSLSSGMTHFPIGIIALEKGVCSAYASIVNRCVQKMNEDGISYTLVSMSNYGAGHEWNVIGLNTGTDNEKWYYMDLANGTYLIGYDNNIIKSNPAMYSYDSNAVKNSDGTYTIKIDSEKEIRLQSSDLLVPYSKGDVTGDGDISMADATSALIIYARSTAGISTDEYTSVQKKAADIDGDGEITMSDATAILSYYAMNAAGLTPEWN